jgi:hypothetical protein
LRGWGFADLVEIKLEDVAVSSVKETQVQTGSLTFEAALIEFWKPEKVLSLIPW